MKPEIIEKLRQLNKEFYEKVAESFDSKRTDGWTGWEEFLKFVKDEEIRINHVLDLGSGNGRLAPLLKKEFPDVRYVGIDQSIKLVEMAKERYKDEKTDFIVRNIEDYLALPSDSKFDLISMIAVMHHIPGFDNRVRLVRKAAELLADDGIMVLTFWQFMENPKLGEKVLDWSVVRLDQKDLEENDFVLGWDNQPNVYRYNHYHNDNEIHILVEKSGLEVAREYEYTGGSGKLNKTVILRKR